MVFRIDDLMVSVLPDHRGMADDSDCTACTECTADTAPPSTCSDETTSACDTDAPAEDAPGARVSRSSIEALLVAQLDQELATRS